MNYTLPPQQILQANGESSIKAIRMSPNSSVLIADTTAPIVWKCVSDGLGNVTTEAFDISHHKTDEEVEKENTNNLLMQISERLERLENNYESITNRHNEPTSQTTYADDKNISKSTDGFSTVNAKQSRYETGY
ncbi:MAG: hypothetical protein J5725_00760 [Bacteroidales bacterium]|nr:hypothetical protein [Bacteroidales bacterium]